MLTSLSKANFYISQKRKSCARSTLQLPAAINLMLTNDLQDTTVLIPIEATPRVKAALE